MRNSVIVLPLYMYIHTTSLSIQGAHVHCWHNQLQKQCHCVMCIHSNMHLMRFNPLIMLPLFLHVCVQKCIQVEYMATLSMCINYKNAGTKRFHYFTVPLKHGRAFIKWHNQHFLYVFLQRCVIIVKLPFFSNYIYFQYFFGIFFFFKYFFHFVYVCISGQKNARL